MNALKDIRIIDFSWLLPGPYATALLADMGADVIKVEQPGRGDYAREILSDHFEMANRNKRGIALDLKQPEARDLALKLIEKADVVIEGYRPGVMAKFGLGPEALLERFPRLIYCSISGFGQDGPYRDRPGHDIGYNAVGGGYSIPGDLKYPSVKGTLPVADLSSGMFAALSIMGALAERQQSGKGQYLDVAMTDCIAAWAGIRLGNVLWEGELAPNRLNAVSRIYETADGSRIALACTEDQFWQNFCKATQRPDLLADERWKTLDGRREFALALLPEIEVIMKQRTAKQWLALFEAADVPASPVNGPLEVFEDPQIKHRQMTWQAPADGSGKPRRVIAYPVKFSRTNPVLRNVSPRLGQDTDAVLREAGLDNETIAAMRARKVVA